MDICTFFVRYTCKNHIFAWQLRVLGFSVDSISGLKCYLMLVLRSQFVEYLRETLYNHALEHLEAAHPENKMEKNVFLRKRLTIIDPSEGL